MDQEEAASGVTRALSIRQPWASLIVEGHKALENRSWSTEYRGRIAVHASAGDAWRDYLRFLEQPEFTDDEEEQAKFRDYMLNGSGFQRPTVKSAIIGTVELLEIVENAPESEVPDELPGFDVSPLVWAGGVNFLWLLGNPCQFAHPIPCDGKLNLWYLTPELTQAVADAEEQWLRDNQDDNA